MRVGLFLSLFNGFHDFHDADQWPIRQISSWGKATEAEKTRHWKPWLGSSTETSRIQLDSAEAGKALEGYPQQWQLSSIQFNEQSQQRQQRWIVNQFDTYPHCARYWIRFVVQEGMKSHVWFCSIWECMHELTSFIANSCWERLGLSNGPRHAICNPWLWDPLWRRELWHLRALQDSRPLAKRNYRLCFTPVHSVLFACREEVLQCMTAMSNPKCIWKL